MPACSEFSSKRTRRVRAAGEAGHDVGDQPPAQLRRSSFRASEGHEEAGAAETVAVTRHDVAQRPSHTDVARHHLRRPWRRVVEPRAIGGRIEDREVRDLVEHAVARPGAWHASSGFRAGTREWRDARACARACASRRARRPRRPRRRTGAASPRGRAGGFMRARSGPARRRAAWKCSSHAPDVLFKDRLRPAEVAFGKGCNHGPVLAERPVPDPVRGHEVVRAQGRDPAGHQAIGGDQVLVRAVIGDGLVERGVRPGDAEAIARIPGLLHRVGSVAHLAQGFVAPPGEAETQRRHLHNAPELGQLGNVFLRGHEHEASGLGPDVDEPLELQRGQRVADRRAADVQGGRELEFGKRFPQREDARP